MKMLLKRLLVTIVEAVIRDLGPLVILLGGTGCVGKSFFSEELAKHLRSSLGLKVSILDLDCYLIEREKRESGPTPISGYNPVGYELPNASNDIKSLLKGKKIIVSPYDKVVSRRTKKIQVEPAEILIIEGVMAMTEHIRSFGRLLIFFDAEKEVEYKNRLIRENGFGFDPDRTKRKFELLREDYGKFIVPQKRFADILVNVGNKYEFLSVELRGSLNLI